MIKKSPLFLFALASFAIMSEPVFASTTTEIVPETLCVTTQTQTMHASAISRMRSDIAPYASSTGALGAIQLYEQELDTAWSAMLQPYCGFGVYGTASAVKSYGKSVERARTAFLAADKKSGGPAVSSTLMVPVIPALTVSASTKPVVKTVTAQVARLRIPRGLSIGMQSDAVAELQRRLSDHFGISKSTRHVTGYFGKITRGLVVRFQIEKRIISGEDDENAGLIGPRTTAALNAMTE